MDDEKINSVLQQLYRLAYPMVTHGIPTQVFHDAIHVIAHLRNEVKKSKNSENEKWVLRVIGTENNPLFWCSKKGWVRTPFEAKQYVTKTSALKALEWFDGRRFQKDGVEAIRVTS
jgi:hypothetical protein